MSTSVNDDARQAVDEVARTSYGRLVAHLSSTTSDLAAAEDAMADAFEAALRTWPERGIPDRPTSWMITAAKRSLISRSRRRAVAERALPSLALLAAERDETPPGSAVGDKRLELLFACAHPAIDPRVHAPLMLQAVLGLDVARMAPAFLLPPATLGQRLVRAKQKIRDAGIAFRLPEGEDLAPRAGAVLDAIYAAYATGWEDPLGTDQGRSGLVHEALRLAELTAQLLGHPEADGLLALLLHSHARSTARRDARGNVVRLADQDPDRWCIETIDRADRHLALAFDAANPGPYQIHAAIQSLHNDRARSGTTSWPAIAALYDSLVVLAPSIGASVARAAAHLEARGPDQALPLLDDLGPTTVAAYQPYWAVRAEVLHRFGDRPAEQAAALARAIELTTDPAVRADLARRVTTWGATDEVGAA